MAPELGLWRLVVAALGDALEPLAERARATDQPDDREDEGEDDDQQPTDDRADIGGDEAVEVDRASSWVTSFESSVPLFTAAHCYPSARHGQTNPIRQQARPPTCRPPSRDGC